MSKSISYILSLLVALLVGGVAGYMIRGSLDAAANEQIVRTDSPNMLYDTSNVDRIIVSYQDDTVQVQTETPGPMPDVVEVTVEKPELGEPTSVEPDPIVELESEPEPARPVSRGREGGFAAVIPPRNNCFGSDDELGLQLTLLAERMEKDSLWYDMNNPSRLQDCSGIFHRISQFVEKKCDGYKYPSTKTARDSRSLSGWFHQNGNLQIIEDPVSSRNLIRPGSVMFFGGTGKHFQNMTIDQLSAPYPNGIVEHIGVVTEVSKNEDGDVTGYVMMHGRRPGVFAQRSHYHSIDPPRFGYPPLGNWNQQWIGIGYIMTP